MASKKTSTLHPDLEKAAEGNARAAEPKSTKTESKRRPLTAALKASIAVDRFKGLSDGGTPTPIKQLAEGYGRDPAVISRAIASAFQERLVEVLRIDIPEEPLPCQDLEEQLLR